MQALAGRLPSPRRATFASLRGPGDEHPLDDAVVLWLPGPNSATGEDTAELHLHGGRAVISAALAALGGMHGLRPAEAGEFTRRAFENGRMDLTAVEGLSDLLRAETEAQRRMAYRHMTGALGRLAEEFRATLIDAIALVEAGIDFPDEGDVPPDLMANALAKVRELDAAIELAMRGGDRGERLREGLTVAITGPPNAGKSSLINRMAQRDVAIVTPYPGTTRDVIEVNLDLSGFPVTVLDTAGIRDAADPVEQEGVNRARERAASADLVLWVVDLTCADQRDPMVLSQGKTWIIGNKADLVDSLPKQNLLNRFASENILYLSARTGEGLETLLDAIASFARDFFSGVDMSMMTRARHRAAFLNCRAALQRALHVVEGGDELVAEELRSAARELERLTGRIDPELVLDRVFRDFCIGK